MAGDTDFSWPPVHHCNYVPVQFTPEMRLMLACTCGNYKVISAKRVE